MSKIDPFYNLFQYFIDPYICSLEMPHSSSCTIGRLLSIPVRYILMILILFEGCHSYITCVTALFYWLEMQTKYFNNLKLIRNPKQVSKHITMFKIALGTWENCLSEWMRILMGTFFVVITVFTIVSIKYASKIPIQIYWLIPTFGVTDMVIIYFVFEFVMGCHEDSTMDLYEQRNRIICENTSGRLNFENKITLKTLLGIRPISIKCGGSFILKRKTKSTYYATIVETTVNGILLS